MLYLELLEHCLQKEILTKIISQAGITLKIREIMRNREAFGETRKSRMHRAHWPIRMRNKLTIQMKHHFLIFGQVNDKCTCPKDNQMKTLNVKACTVWSYWIFEMWIKMVITNISFQKFLITSQKWLYTFLQENMYVITFLV